MKHLFAALLVAVLFTCPFTCPLPARAEGTPPSVQKAEAYLQQLTTARARFLQTAQDGTQLLGTFYLSRPGRLRFEYDEPVRDFIVADGFFIYFYDAQMGAQTNAPIGQTLADFLLRSDLSLSGDVTVKEVKRSGGMLQITLVQTSDPGAGTMTLGLEENPTLKLRKWRVTDATGAVTEVELFEIEQGIALPGGLFAYVDPAKGGARKFNE